MSTRLNPYLSFRDNAREAMEFYQSIFGGELTMSTFAEYHASEDPAEADKIMHSQLDHRRRARLMAADTPNSMDYSPGNTTRCRSAVTTRASCAATGTALRGGTVTMPLEKAPWGDSFGMCADRYGVSWMVNIAGDKPQGRHAR